MKWGKPLSEFPKAHGSSSHYFHLPQKMNGSPGGLPLWIKPK